MSLVGMFISTGVDDLHRPSAIYKTYSSIEELWTNKDRHQTFVLCCWLPGVRDFIPQIKEYCLTNKKTLFVDIHDHYLGCILPPNLINITVNTNYNIK